jgi:hypothetical protein
VTFHNSDIDSHNVTAQSNGADGKALFTSQTVGLGQTTAVSGTQYLTTGSYSFYCTIHPYMHGTLVVTSAGTPVPRPGQSPGAGGSSPPSSSTTSAPTGHHKRHKHHRRTRHKRSTKAHR